MTGGPLVLHLNGPPGVGKSTLAQRWADAHPGTLLLDPDEGELARFKAAATDAGGVFVEVLIEANNLRERFQARRVDEPWLEAVHALVEEAPDNHLEEYAARLTALADRWPGVIRLPTRPGEVDRAYDELADAVASATGR